MTPTSEERIRANRRIRSFVYLGVAVIAFGLGCLVSYLRDLTFDSALLFHLGIGVVVGILLSEGVGRLIDHIKRRRA